MKILTSVCPAVRGLRFLCVCFKLVLHVSGFVLFENWLDVFFNLRHTIWKNRHLILCKLECVLLKFGLAVLNITLERLFIEVSL